MDTSQFEQLLDSLVLNLSIQARSQGFSTSKAFENSVRDELVRLSSAFNVNFTPHPYVFPDIVLDEFGIEVKFTTNDTWRSVANSVFESTRSQDVRHVYIVFGKMGGKPEVKWGKYDDCVMHARTSHVPRFEVEIGAPKSLFEKMGTTYEAFRNLTEEDKMKHIRKYACGRLKQGERLWWLEDAEDSSHSLPLQAKLYTSLEQEEKRRLRAESVLLCPQVLKSSRSKRKYDDAVLYMLTYRGVLCHQARDLFSAGSVALRANSQRGGNYLMRALQDIQNEILAAANYLEDALFEEYWGKIVSRGDRIRAWLLMADSYASGWKPSDELFKG